MRVRGAPETTAPRSWRRRVGVAGIAGLVALLLVGQAAPARAQASDSSLAACLARSGPWVAKAASALPFPVEAKGCSARRLLVRLAPPGAEEIDVGVDRGASSGLRRVGALWLSPLLEGDWSQVDPRRRAAFDALAGWLAAHPADLAPRSRLPALLPSGRLPWLLLVALLLGLYPAVASLRGRRDALYLGVALFTLALMLRGLLGAWGPFHFNGQGPLWMLGAFAGGGETAAYGPGYAEMYGWLARLGVIAPDRALFACNCLLSATTAPAIAALAGLAGLGRRRAMLLGLLAAADPIAIRVAATESYFNAALALPLAAAVLGMLAAGAWERAPRVAWPAVLAAAALLVEAARVHPVSWPPAALACLAPLAASAPRKARLRACAVLLAASGALAFLSSAGPLVAVLRDFGTNARPAVPSLIPFAVLAVATVAVLVAGGEPWLALLAAASVAGYLLERGAYWDVWRDALLRLLLAWPVLALASVGRRARWGAVVDVLAGAGAAAALWSCLTVRPPPDVEQQEYAWMRRQVARIPAGCTLFYLSRAGRGVLYLPVFPGYDRPRALRVDLRDGEGAPDPSAPGACLYYVHDSLCSRAETSPACARFERTLSLEELDHARFRPGPDDGRLAYRAPDVEVALDRVKTPPAPAASRPR